MNRFFVTLLAIGVSSLWAEQTPDPLPSLGKPLVQKVSWNSRSLIAQDMNADGLTDLVLVNNDEGKIDILLQKKDGEDAASIMRKVQRNRWEPELENAPFTRESVVTGDAMYAVAAADLDADGLMDLVFTSKQHPLGVLFQREEGGFDEAIYDDGFEPVPWTTAIRVLDLEGDGDRELLLLAKRKLLVYPLESGRRELSDPEMYPLAGDVPYGLDAVDFDGDGRLDLYYELGNEDRPFRIRLQGEDGNLSRSYAFDLKLGPDIVQHVGEHVEGAPLMAYIQSKTGLIETFTLERSAQKLTGSSELVLQPLVYSARESGDEPVEYARGDFDGDGRVDIVAADPGTPEVRWFRAHSEGYQGMQHYPALANISDLSAGRLAEGSSDVLLMFSERDKAIALSRYEDGRFGFPESITVEGEPQSVQFADMDGDELDELLVVVKEDKDYHLKILRWDAESAGFVVWKSRVLEDVKRAPHTILAEDISGDGLKEVLILVRREGARLFRNVGGEEVLEPVTIEASLRGSLFDDLQPESVAFSHVLGDETAELILASTGFVRAFSLNEAGELRTEDQFNARGSEDKVRAPAAFDIDADGEVEVVVYDPSAKGFQVIERDEDGVFRYDRFLDAGTLQARSLSVDVSLNAFLLMGESRFWYVPMGHSGWSMKMHDNYETDLDGVRYTLFLVSRFREDGEPYFIMVDGKKHLLELLSYDVEAGWKSRMHFMVFDENMHYRGKRGAPHEPKEVVIADVTGDGLRDMVLLVHDRVLLYPQQAEEITDE